MPDIADRAADLPPRDPSKPDTEQGLFQKFIVTRTDGSSGPGGKHEGCEHFVLDTDHDPHAPAALAAYATEVERTHPQLAADMRLRYRLPPTVPLEVSWSNEMVSVPILRNFDNSDPLGWLQIRRDALPPTPDFCFSIGYKVLRWEQDRVIDYQLQSVAIIHDATYRKVIDQEAGRRLVQPTEEWIRKLRARAIGIARDVAQSCTPSGPVDLSSTYGDLAEHLLNEPEVVKAIGAWFMEVERAVDQPGSERNVRRLYSSAEQVLKLRAHAFGVCRDIADRFAQEANDGSSSPALFRRLANRLLSEPEVIDAIGAWREASQEHAENPSTPAPWGKAPAADRTHARRMLAQYAALELRATLSAHQEEWWRINREREACEADILRVLAAGLHVRKTHPGRLMSEAQGQAAIDALRGAKMPMAVPGRCRDLASKLRWHVLPDSWISEGWNAGMLADLLEQIADHWNRRPAAGTNLSQGKPPAVHATPVLLETTALWAGAKMGEADGVSFTSEAWAKFVKCLSEEPPLEILTSPGVSAPVNVVYDECVARGCREDRPCAQGQCARGPGEPT